MIGGIYLLSWLVLGMMVLRRPSLIVRPSVWFSIGLMVRIGGGAAFAHVPLQDLLHEISLLRWIVVFLPFGVMVWLGLSQRLTLMADDLYGRCRSAAAGGEFGDDERNILKLFALVSLGILGVYFLFVPISSSGLVTIFRDPFNAAAAREESFKLISFTPVRYGYIWHMEMLAPVTAVLLTMMPIRRRTLAWTLKAVAVVMIFLSVMVTGARAPAGLILMTLALVQVLKRGVHRGLPVLVAAIASAVLLAAVLSVFRDGRGDQFSLTVLSDYLSGGLFDRVFIVPYETGVMTNLYAQNNGLLGVSNIRPLALIFGQPFVALPNEVGLTYMMTRVASVSANTSYLFDLQASFGMLTGSAAAMIVLCLLDPLLLAFRRLRGGLLLAFFATFMTAQHFLTSSALTPCLLSHGVLLLPLSAWLMGRWRTGKRRDSR